MTDFIYNLSHSLTSEICALQDERMTLRCALAWIKGMSTDVADTDDKTLRKYIELIREKAVEALEKKAVQT